MSEPSSRFGYHGNILRVDLTNGRIEVETPEEKFYRLYAGGGLMATVLLMRETQAGLDAFDPAN